MVTNRVTSLWKRPYHYGCPLQSLCPGPSTSMQETIGEPMNGVLRNPVLPPICRPIPFLVKTGHTHTHTSSTLYMRLCTYLKPKVAPSLNVDQTEYGREENEWREMEGAASSSYSYISYRVSCQRLQIKICHVLFQRSFGRNIFLSHLL